eukprot:gnl/Spiro4/16602_TR8939_c0_g1_i1.p1 gnl/Spiro4/16602_TR8939_c0_g1~~gnl/Spiro4/16602_TR8939_c0_g1_i1.p1  ORF type:complete len:200 (+),score=4.74 gnl/Spiro4/16602_TR8939_c0_g1_i1:47-601(+)
MNMLTLFIGTRNEEKIQAVRTAFASHFRRPLDSIQVTGIDVPSTVRSQPIGRAETQTGAAARANNVRNVGINTHESQSGCYFVGIENGLVFDDDLTVDLACAVVCFVDNGECSQRAGWSDAMALPLELRRRPGEGEDEWIEQYRAVIMPMVRAKQDLYLYFSQNTRTRREAMETAVTRALLQLE